MPSTFSRLIASGLCCLLGLVLVLTGLNIIPGASTSLFPHHLILTLGGIFVLSGLSIVGRSNSTVVKLGIMTFIGLFIYLFVWLTFFAPAAIADAAIGIPRPYNFWIFRLLNGIGVLVGAVMLIFAIRRFIVDRRGARAPKFRKLISSLAI